MEHNRVRRVEFDPYALGLPFELHHQPSLQRVQASSTF